MTNILTLLFFSTTVFFFHCFSVTATISPSTYKEKVRAELFDNSEKFSDAAKAGAARAIELFDELAQTSSGQDKEIFNDAKVFFKTGNITCTVNYLKRKIKGLNQKKYRALMEELAQLQNGSGVLSFRLGFDSNIQFNYIISHAQMNYRYAINMTAADIQSQELSTNNRKYLFQSPDNYQVLQNGGIVSKDKYFIALATGDTAAYTFLLTPKNRIAAQDLCDDIKNISQYKIEDGEKIYNIDPVIYSLYNVTKSGISIKEFFYTINMMMGSEERNDAKESLKIILDENIREAEIKLPTKIIIDEETLEENITNKLISILSANEGELAQLFNHEDWRGTKIEIPLSNYHRRDRYWLQLDFDYILTQSFPADPTYLDKVLNELPNNMNRFPKEMQKIVQEFVRICEVDEIAPLNGEDIILKRARIFLQLGAVDTTQRYLEKNKNIIGNYLYNYLSSKLEKIETERELRTYNSLTNQEIIITTLIPLNKLTALDIKQLIAAHYQSLKPLIGEQDYHFLSPSMILLIDNQRNDDPEFTTTNSNENKTHFFTIEKPIIPRDDKHKVPKSFSAEPDGSLRLIYEEYILNRILNPKNNFYLFFEHLQDLDDQGNGNGTPDDNSEWLSNILRDNISDAERKYPYDTFIPRNKLQTDLENQFKSFLSNDSTLKEFLLDRGWGQAVIKVPLSSYHVRDQFFLEINFSNILQ